MSKLMDVAIAEAAQAAPDVPRLAESPWVAAVVLLSVAEATAAVRLLVVLVVQDTALLLVEDAEASLTKHKPSCATR